LEWGLWQKDRRKWLTFFRQEPELTLALKKLENKQEGNKCIASTATAQLMLSPDTSHEISQIYRVLCLE